MIQSYILSKLYTKIFFWKENNFQVKIGWKSFEEEKKELLAQLERVKMREIIRLVFFYIKIFILYALLYFSILLGGLGTRHFNVNIPNSNLTKIWKKKTKNSTIFLYYDVMIIKYSHTKVGVLSHPQNWKKVEIATNQNIST